MNGPDYTTHSTLVCIEYKGEKTTVSPLIDCGIISINTDISQYIEHPIQFYNYYTDYDLQNEDYYPLICEIYLDPTIHKNIIKLYAPDDHNISNNNIYCWISLDHELVIT